jgi:flagellar protein FlgJ
MALQNLAAADVSGQLAVDARALAGLKAQSKTAPGEALRAAAGQFEALFMQMLLKSMRDALPQEGPFASETTKTYTAMFDQQIAQQLAKKGIGIADVLVKQLSPRTGTAAAPATATTASERKAAASPGVGSATGTSPAASAAPAGPSATPAAPVARTGGSLPETARAFLEKMRPHAEAAAKAAGIPASYLLAQAALETGWGRHQPKAADGSTSHNLFGIKAGTAWQGTKTVAATTEYVAGRAVRALESFRSYASYGEAFQDFARLLRGNNRYAGALANTGNAEAYAQSLQQAGYATDPRYADKLARIIEAVNRHTAAGTPQVAAAAADKPSGSA